jgi:hypothetical protein
MAFASPRSGHFTPVKTRYPLYRGLGGPQGQSVRVRKISPPPGFFFCTITNPRTVQPVVSRYTNWATRPIQICVTMVFITELRLVEIPHLKNSLNLTWPKLTSLWVPFPCVVTVKYIKLYTSRHINMQTIEVLCLRAQTRLSKYTCGLADTNLTYSTNVTSLYQNLNKTFVTEPRTKPNAQS